MSSFEKRIPNEVEAIRLVYPIYDEKQRKLADEGEWIITDGVSQFYMKDEDFKREFVKKDNKEVITTTQYYPVYVEKEIIREVPYPSPCRPWDPWDPWDPWKPWVPGDYYPPTVWCSSDGYLASHT